MGEVGRINDQLKRAFEGTAWHGPSLREVLDDVTAAKASARPLAGAHTIWEIVLHIAVWEDVARRRIEGETVEPTTEQDWAAVTATTEAAWSAALDSLRAGHMKLRSSVAALSDSQLAEIAPGCEYNIYFLLHGVIQHDLYHAGQIAILKKALD
ncbi:MAG TPA: DinB family protein [Blastocatellia bacterium]|nr:DinB family protein [Blastocatellia bacterium]